MLARPQSTRGLVVVKNVSPHSLACSTAWIPVITSFKEKTMMMGRNGTMEPTTWGLKISRTGWGM